MDCVTFGQNQKGFYENKTLTGAVFILSQVPGWYDFIFQQAKSLYIMYTQGQRSIYSIYRGPFSIFMTSPYIYSLKNIYI